MTEDEWLTCDQPAPMLAFARGSMSARKLRLFSCACCRRAARLMPDSRSCLALNVAERVADGLADDAERQRALGALQGVPHDHSQWSLADDAYTAAVQGAVATAHAVSWATKLLRRYQAGRFEEAAQAVLLCEIFGNPFRPVEFSADWCTDTALSLARQMYDSRDFGAMPILADALQDAGCDSEDILQHCRGSGPHVRGCWVVDLVLGKQ
jgi:hypothetical protein